MSEFPLAKFDSQTIIDSKLEGDQEPTDNQTAKIVNTKQVRFYDVPLDLLNKVHHTHCAQRPIWRL